MWIADSPRYTTKAITAWALLLLWLWLALPTWGQSMSSASPHVPRQLVVYLRAAGNFHHLKTG